MFLLAITDFGSRLLDSVGHAFDVLLGFIPALIGAIVLLIIGWILSNIAANVTRRVLMAIHFDQLMQHAGVDTVAQRFGFGANANTLLADLVKWFIRLIFILAAFNALQIPAITNILNAIVLWLPSLFVALLIVVIGAALARVAREATIRTLTAAGTPQRTFLGSLVQYGIVTLALFIALEQIGVGMEILTILFAGVMLALSLGAGLAFGLGGRETAKRLVDTWYPSVPPALSSTDAASPPSPLPNERNAVQGWKLRQ